MKKLIALSALLLVCSWLHAQQPGTEAHGKIIANTNVNALRQLSAQWKAEATENYQEALTLAQQNNWVIRQEFEDGSVMELVGVDESGKPIYHKGNNVVSAQVMHTSDVHQGPYNLQGQNMLIGLWEAGGVPRATHQQYNGRVTNIDVSASTTHASHVCGTLIGNGTGNAAAKGMAPLATVRSYTSTNHTAEMAAEAANGLLVSNHSYGIVCGWDGGTWTGVPNVSIVEDYFFGYYDASVAVWDNIAFNAPNYLIVNSVGNDRNDADPDPNNAPNYPPDCNQGEGYDCISTYGNAKNILTVGAVEDDGQAMSAFSGWGPTDDGRIKPDVVANGVGLLSAGMASDAAYVSSSGTSMSAPSISGSCILLQEHYQKTHNNSSMLSATLKALVIHTADDIGPAGPDYQNGWGRMNTLKAAQLIDQDVALTTTINENTLQQNTPFSINVESDGTKPIVATLVWTDPAAAAQPALLDNPASVLINDLDIRISKGNTTFSPFILNPANPAALATTGDNVRDNAESIIIATPVAGTYTITINHKGNLQNGAQTFSLIISGHKSNGLANQTITFNALPTKTVGDAPFNLTATASSGLPISYTTSNPAVATVNGSTITIVGVGNTTITASQAGNNQYAAASPVQQVLTVNNNNVPKPFITVWKTDNPGGSANNQIRIPGTGVNYIIEWENVNNLAQTGNAIGNNMTTVTFPAPGTYRVKISGNFTRINFSGSQDETKILDIEQWGDVKWSTMNYAFSGCSNLTISTIDNPNLSNVSNMSFMFNNATSFNQSIDNWDVSNVTDMTYMFFSAHSFNQPIGNWNVSNVTKMGGMFYKADSFNQPIGTWNVSKVTDMSSMFWGAIDFNQPIGGWDVANVTSMSYMFAGHILIGNTSFNQFIGAWDVSKVTNMTGMFDGAIHFNQSLQNWNVSNVVYMGNMFQDAENFDQPIGSWDMSNVTNISNMFSDAIAFNQSLENWNLTSLKYIEGIFSGAISFNKPLNTWNVSAVKFLSRVFEGANSFNQPLNNWDITNVISMTNILSNSGLSTANYDATLQGWAAQNVKPNIALGAVGLEYCAGEAARQSLITNKNWTITGDTKDCVNNNPIAAAPLWGITNGTFTGQPDGYGAIFSIQPDGTGAAKAYTFDGTDGKVLTGGIIQGTDDLVYGTTRYGGASNMGIVFKVNTDGTGFTKLADFSGATGADPQGGLVQGNDNTLYGTTTRGGTNDGGIIFKINPDGSGFAKLQDLPVGSAPRASLLQLNNVLYGSTHGGGAQNKGTLFKINTDGTGFAIMKDFSGADGANPHATLIQALDGVLYGTASTGGTNNKGVLFKIKTDGTSFTTLHHFAGDDGEAPLGALVQATDSYLYGTTLGGGKKIVQGGTVQYGTIFRIKTDGTNFEKLHAFGGAGDGSFPDGGLVQYEDSDLYGLTLRGGTNDKGVLFKLKDEDLSYHKLYDFDSTLGGNPRGSLVRWKE